MKMMKLRNLLRKDCESAISGVSARFCSRGTFVDLFLIRIYHSKTGDWIEDSDEEIAELDRREAAAEQARLAALVPPLTLGGGTPES